MTILDSFSAHNFTCYSSDGCIFSQGAFRQAITQGIAVKIESEIPLVEGATINVGDWLLTRSYLSLCSKPTLLRNLKLESPLQVEGALRPLLLRGLRRLRSESHLGEDEGEQNPIVHEEDDGRPLDEWNEAIEWLLGGVEDSSEGVTAFHRLSFRDKVRQEARSPGDDLIESSSCLRSNESQSLTNHHRLLITDANTDMGTQDASPRSLQDFPPLH